MTGPVEVPPGDPDGTGTATITLDATKGEVCVDFTVADIETATAAHIHDGGVGVAGPIVVDLPVPATGTAKGCVAADAALVTAIIADPAAYYVNVHNNAYPKGALRAQLGGGPTAVAASVLVTGAVLAHCSLQVV
jgi:CHRD domain-containing protein